MEFSFTYAGPANIIFGKGASQDVGAHFKRLGLKRVLVVTDAGLKKAGVVGQILTVLKNEKIEFDIFDNVDPSPTVDNVKEGSSVFKSGKTQGLLALGGGSPIDAAKGIALVKMTGTSIDEIMEKGVPPVRERVSLITLPTTAGSGSEVSLTAMIKDKVKKKKVALREIPPAVTIYDPLLTLTMPPRITKSSGMDAFAHAVGSYTNKVFNPVVDAGNLEAIRLISENLPLVISKGDNLDARTFMLYGNMQAGIGVFNTGADLTHGIGTLFEASFDCVHGEVCAVLMPHCVEYSIPGDPEKYCQVARAMGEHVNGLTPMEGATKALSAIRNLLSKIGMPQRLRDLGLVRGKIQEMWKSEETLRMATRSRAAQANCRAITIDEMITLCERAY
ncbi:MAG: iron-containing alcohol dehydrogenase family protein [Thermodesulfobacteriota bacterium]